MNRVLLKISKTNETNSVFNMLAGQRRYFEARLVCALISGLVAGFCLTQLYFNVASKKSSFVAVENHHRHTRDESFSPAEQLKKEVRVLCWIMTNPKNHRDKASHIKRTWGKRCNILLFMSSEVDNELPTVKLDVGEGRGNLWRKVKEAFKYVYKHHYNDADWFYKADDDTYAVIENLHYMLYPYNPETPVHFGFKFKPFVKQGYMSGGAGYVLSREAVRRFVVEGIPDPKMCLPGSAENEDVEIGKCLEKLNVTAGDSRDGSGRGRMYPFNPSDHINAKYNKDYWYWNYTYYNTTDGRYSLSDTAISFHYIPPKQMYELEYLIYRLRPFGVINEQLKLPAKLALGEFMPEPNTTGLVIELTSK